MNSLLSHAARRAQARAAALITGQPGPNSAAVLPSGAPTMALTGGALARLQKILPRGHRAAIHLTITDDFPLAQAFVIIEAVPVEEAPH